MAEKKTWKPVSLSFLLLSCPASPACYWNSSPLLISSASKRVLTAWVTMAMREFLVAWPVELQRSWEGRRKYFSVSWFRRIHATLQPWSWWRRKDSERGTLSRMKIDQEIKATEMYSHPRYKSFLNSKIWLIIFISIATLWLLGNSDTRGLFLRRRTWTYSKERTWSLDPCLLLRTISFF